MFNKNILMMSAATLLAIGSAHPAFAETMSMEDMQKQLEALTKQVQQLSSVVQQQNAIIAQQKSSLETHDAQLQEQSEKLSQASTKVENLAAITPAAGEGQNTEDNRVKISMAPMPKIESADGLYSFQPFGRVHLDYTTFMDDQTDHPNNANFRRARLGFKGDLGEDFNYKIEMDFAKEDVAFKDVFLEYTGFDPVDIRLGNQKPPFGLAQNVSSNYIQFTEIAEPASVFSRDEIIGANFIGGGDNWSLAGGVFNEDAGNTNANDDEAVSVDIGGSFAPVNEGGKVLHIGGGASIRSPNATTESVTHSAKVTGIGNNLVSTGAIANVDRESVYNAELAGVLGSFDFQGEYFWDELDAANDPSFSGWYAQAGYLLTGEQRPYSANGGTFGRIKPAQPFSLDNGTWGAWEVVGRYSNLDLNDTGANVTGGEMSNWTFGVNWYLTDHIRMMADYIDVNTDNNAVVANDDPSVINLRAQLDF